jgi:hypothetical protein
VLAGPVAELTGRLSGVSRRHTGAVIVLMAGAVLRIVMIVAYPPALWFQGDSGACIRRAQQWPQMGNRWPYLWLLMFLEPTGTFYSVELVRHLAGLSLAASGDAFLRQVGVGAWVAAAAIAPMTLDARQLTLEQFILTETLLTTLLGVAALLVVWRNRPGWDACALAGVAVAIGWATRPSGIFAVAVLLLFLQIRWTGWRQPVAYLVNGTAIVGAVVSGGRGQLPGRHGHRRQVHLRPDGALRRLRDPADASSGPGSVPAAAARPAARARPLVHLEPEQPDPQRHGNQALLREFAIDVITQQPGAYAGRRQGDRARYFGPQASVDLPPTTASRVLHAYGQIVVRRRGRCRSRCCCPWWAAPGRAPRDCRLGVTALMYLAMGVGLIVLSVATSMYDDRYGLPALAFIPVAAALAWHRLRTRRTWLKLVRTRGGGWMRRSRQLSMRAPTRCVRCPATRARRSARSAPRSLPTPSDRVHSWGHHLTVDRRLEPKPCRSARLAFV